MKKISGNKLLVNALKEEGVDVIYLPRTPEISSSQIKSDLNAK